MVHLLSAAGPGNPSTATELRPLTLLVKGEFAQDKVCPCHTLLTNQLPVNRRSKSAPLEAVQCTMALASPPNKSSHQAKSQTAAAADTNLASAETHYQVSNEGVLCLSRAVAHHHTPAIGLGQLAAARDQEKQLTPCAQHAACAPLTLPRGSITDKGIRSCCHRCSYSGKLFRAPM